MEEDTDLWQQVFQELIQEVKPWHKWTLTPDKDLLPNVLRPGWMQYQQKAFARFHCPSCSRSWASGHVLMIFHMHWREKKGRGRVKMRAFAQRCNKCPEPPFVAPEFTWDNISRILNNLLFRILKKCYGEGFKEMDEIPLVGDTSLEGPHDSNNCEACLQGFCAQSGLGLAAKSPAPPLSPTSSSKSTRESSVTAPCSNIPCSQPSSKAGKPAASKVNPKASNPTTTDPKVSHTSKPSTVPILTTQQLCPVSSPTPSPLKSNRAADVGNKNTRSKTPEAMPSSSSSVLPTSSSSVPPTSSSSVPPTFTSVMLTLSKYSSPPPSKYSAPPPSKYSAPPPSKYSLPPPSKYSLPPPSKYDALPPSTCVVSPPSSYVAPTLSSHVAPTSWRPAANTTCQAERNSHTYPPRESCCVVCCEACCRVCEGCCRVGACCCECCVSCLERSSDDSACPRCLCLIFVAIVVFLIVNYGI